MVTKWLQNVDELFLLVGMKVTKCGRTFFVSSYEGDKIF